MKPDDPIAVAVRETRNPVVVERAMRRRARVGRGEQLGLHLLVDVVLVEIREHGAHAMPPGQVHATIWTRGRSSVLDVLDIVEDHAPTGLLITFELRRAGIVQRLHGVARVVADIIERRKTRKDTT